MTLDEFKAQTGCTTNSQVKILATFTTLGNSAGYLRNGHMTYGLHGYRKYLICSRAGVPESTKMPSCVRRASKGPHCTTWYAVLSPEQRDFLKDLPLL